jgi:hypothetical protein
VPVEGSFSNQFVSNKNIEWGKKKNKKQKKKKTKKIIK